MKREFLEGLELDKETINTIMVEYGKTTQRLREERDKLKKLVCDYYSKSCYNVLNSKKIKCTWQKVML